MAKDPTRVAAGHKASETKGKEEESRAGYMAGWTRKYGKNDAENPYSKAHATKPRKGLAMKK